MGMGRVGDDPRAPWRRVAARMRAHATSSHVGPARDGLVGCRVAR